MKNLLFAGFTCLLLLSCNDGVKNDDNSQNLVVEPGHQSFQNTQLNGYRGQLPYLKVDANNNSTRFEAENDFASKIPNENVTWTYFDGLYNENLSVPEKQNLAFIILSTKDLIGLSTNDPSNELYKNAIKKYIKVLVETEYIGYCVLYSALDAVKSDNDFVKSKATSIALYSEEETFHKTIIENPEINEYTAKVSEDYTFLHKIKALK